MVEIIHALGLTMHFQTWSQQNCVRQWSQLVVEYGPSILTQKVYRAKGKMGLYNTTRSSGLSMKEVVNLINRSDELQSLQTEHQKTTMTADKFEETAKLIIENFRCIPSSKFLAKNGFNLFSRYVSTYGPTFSEVRKRHGVDDVKLSSIDGQTWRSFAECCLANFLLTRGIEIWTGERYPESYAEFANRSYGVYDMHFKATIGSQMGSKVSVEVFGGGVGLAQASYDQTKKSKIEFHANDPNFMYLEYTDCYCETTLCEKLSHYINTAEAVIVPYPGVPTTMLSHLEDVLRRCRLILDNTSSEFLPVTSWFEKRGVHADRAREEWETFSSANLSKDIANCGGRKIICELLGCQVQARVGRKTQPIRQGRLFKGVVRRSDKYRTIVSLNGKRVHSSSHTTAVLAAKKYNEVVLALGVPNPVLNTIPTNYDNEILDEKINIL